MFIELKHVNKFFYDFQASDDVCFGIEKGTIAALLGPSGSGKTTILRIIAGLESADSGEILINGKNVSGIPPAERGVGFVFQNYALFRYMNVYENIAFGLRVKKLSESSIKARVDELLVLIGLSGLEKRYPNELSGGQKQRIAFARALAPAPEALLLDEPFAAIDAKVRKDLRQWLRDMIHKVGITSIFVTHDHNEAVEVADQIIVMNRGHIEQDGKPKEIYTVPQTAFVSQFIGEHVIIKNFGKLKGFPQGDFDFAVVRPEFVEAFKSDNEHFRDVIRFAQKGVIKDIIFKGTSYELILEVDGIILMSYRSLERRQIRIGEEMNIIVYRLLAIRGNDATLLKNGYLDVEDPDGKADEKYLYGDSGYFTA